MKLAATATAIVASLVLFGCATENDGEGGGHLSGMRPAKPSLDDPKPPFATLNPAIEHVLTGGLTVDIRENGAIRLPGGAEISAENINVPFPIDGLCQVCDSGVIALKDSRFPDEFHIVDDFGQFFCTVWFDQKTGHIRQTNCR